MRGSFWILEVSHWSTALCQYPLLRVDLMLISAAIAPSLKKLLQSKGHDVEVHIQLKNALHPKWARTTAEEMLQISRIMHLDEAELYFCEDDSCSPMGYYTQKNELEALISMLSQVNSSFLDDTCSHKDVLQDLREQSGCKIILLFGDKNITETTVINSQNCDKGNFLLQWGEQSGVKLSSIPLIVVRLVRHLVGC